MAIDILLSFIMLLLYFKTGNLFFLVVIAITVGWSIGASSFNTAYEKKLREHDELTDQVLYGNKSCPPHKWTINEENKLVCEVCKREV